MCGQVTLTEGHPKKEPINPRPLHSSTRNHLTKVLKPASSKSEWGLFRIQFVARALRRKITEFSVH